jgi:hypothetical protein
MTASACFAGRIGPNFQTCRARLDRGIAGSNQKAGHQDGFSLLAG